MHTRGFTLIDTLITITIVGLLVVISAYGFSSLQRSFVSQSLDREVVNLLTSAARKARMGEGGGPWGVYFPYDNTTRTATTAVIFRGTSYAARVAGSELTTRINPNAQFTTVDFSGSATNTTSDHEIVFGYLSGNTTQYGSITMTWYGKTRVITIDPDGFAVRNPL